MDYINLAERTAGWIVRNQVNDDLYFGTPDGYDMQDMNYGRYCRNYNIKEQRMEALGTNWQNGMAMYALLMLHDLNEDDALLKSARASAVFLSMLQNTFSDNEMFLGAISECHPLTRHCHCRDSLSAAWGLLRLYRKTNEIEYLKRASLFADWHQRFAMNGNYVVATVFFDGRPRAEGIFNCQGGSALFYRDINEVSFDNRYNDTMFRIIDFYVENMFDNEQGPIIFIDPYSGYKGDLPNGESADWCDMHKFNDDFGCLAVMTAGIITGESKYFSFIEKYLEWCLSRQHPDGSFGRQSLAVSSCIVVLNLLNAYLLNGKHKYREAAGNAFEHMMQSYINTPENKATDGGILGLGLQCEKTDNSISLRVTTYAIFVFMLYHIITEYVDKGDSSNIPEILKQNPMFIGLRRRNK